MPPRLRNFVNSCRAYLRAIITGPQILLYLPALLVIGHWYGGRELVLGMALGVPVCVAVLWIVNPIHRLPSGLNTQAPDYPDHTALDNHLNEVLKSARKSSQKMACILLALDDFDALTECHGAAITDDVMRRIKKRLGVALRSEDIVYLYGKNGFGVAIGPVRKLDLETGLHLAGRLQAAVEDPIVLGPTTVQISASLGLALDKDVGSGGGADLSNAAHFALNEARRHGPSSIRAYSPITPDLSTSPHYITDGLEAALENGQIRPWFQPQVSTDTGQITGFEALARWAHPELGMVSPADFLPGLGQVGKLERLGEVILFQALNALKSWDTQGLDVPYVGVNFTPEELRDPKLPEKIGWELDRFDIPASRLTIEILETVVASSADDMITRSINRLAEMGCRIDLDDFGTGHASISLIRQFAVKRIKIDRSFVTNVDCDAEQQRMVSAILLMAEKLGLDTLAEGVETAGEHAMLAQLGCGNVQGFGIGRPMPFEKTTDWMSHYLLKLDDLPVIGQVKN